MRKRLRIALFAGPIAALAFMAFSASAVAGNGPVSEAEDPQTANTPYLAWAGNQVRLAKCLGEEEMESDLRLAPSQIDSLLTPGLLLRAKFRLEDWSGTEPNATGAGYRSTASIEPQFLNDQDGDTVAYLQDGRLCFSVTVSSLKPGLAVIKGAARIDLAGFTPGFDILGKHQFVVIWMRSQAPAIREVANADFPDLDLGDPSGNRIFNPFPTGTPFRNGLVEITVGGNFPLGNDFAGIDADNVVNLPADWAWLASKFAVDDYDATGGRPGSARCVGTSTTTSFRAPTTRATTTATRGPEPSTLSTRATSASRTVPAQPTTSRAAKSGRSRTTSASPRARRSGRSTRSAAMTRCCPTTR